MSTKEDWQRLARSLYRLYWAVYRVLYLDLIWGRDESQDVK